MTQIAFHTRLPSFPITAREAYVPCDETLDAAAAAVDENQVDIQSMLLKNPASLATQYTEDEAGESGK
jgi:hypothetical protein